MGPNLLPVVAPIIGAFVAFLLNRGTRLRRTRTAALEDLQLVERMATILKQSDPMADQIRAHAMTSVRNYTAARAISENKASRRAARLVFPAILVGLCVLTVAAGIDEVRQLTTLGLVGGALGVAGESWLDRRNIRETLRRLPALQDRPEGR